MILQDQHIQTFQKYLQLFLASKIVDKECKKDIDGIYHKFFKIFAKNIFRKNYLNL